MKVLITGGTGYIGLNLVRFLSEKGVNVALLERKERHEEGVLSFSYDQKYEGINYAFEAFKPDNVIHLAASFDNENIHQLIDCNFKMPVYLLDACSKHGVEAFLYAGSFWQFGSESQVGVPLDLYAASKRCFEEMVDYYAKRRNVKSIELVLYGTYGSKDDRGKIIEFLIRAIKENKRIDMSFGEQYLNLVHVEDVCGAFYECMIRSVHEGRHSKYCISSMKQYSLRELIRACEVCLNRKIDVNWGGVPYRANEVYLPLYLYNRPVFWRENHNIIDFICKQVEG